MKTKKNSSFFLLFTGVIFLSVAMLNVGCHKTASSNAVQTVPPNSKALPFINPPVKNYDIAYTSYKINSGKEIVITHSSGSRIYIPANAFTDEKGNSLNGEVTILYREMQNAWDFFVTGIPMTFKKDSFTCHFESAGMFDIQATATKRSVSIARNKTIRVEMITHNSAERFNRYYLDMPNRRWIDLGKSEAKRNRRKTPNDSSVSVPLKAVIPLKPRNADSVLKILLVRIANRSQFPEFDAFQNLKFEVVEDHGQYKAGNDPMQCSQPTITPSEEKPGFYMLRMKVIKKEISYWINWLVRPAFEGNDYQKAMSIYNEELQKYKEEVKRIKQQKIENEKAIKRFDTAETFYRSTEVRKFGTYNCDYPIRNAWPEFIPVFLTPDGKDLNIKEVMIIDKTINGIFRYELAYSPKIRMNRESQQIIIGIADDASLYAGKSNEDERCGSISKNNHIVMNPYRDMKVLEKEIAQYTVK